MHRRQAHEQFIGHLLWQLLFIERFLLITEIQHNTNEMVRRDQVHMQWTHR